MSAEITASLTRGGVTGVISLLLMSNLDSVHGCSDLE